MLLSAWVERCFVSRMRDFLFTLWQYCSQYHKKGAFNWFSQKLLAWCKQSWLVAIWIFALFCRNSSFKKKLLAEILGTFYRVWVIWLLMTIDEGPYKSIFQYAIIYSKSQTIFANSLKFINYNSVSPIYFWHIILKTFPPLIINSNS